MVWSFQAGCATRTESIKKRNYKPVSRILYPDRRPGGYHLSCPAITDRIILPTHPTYPFGIRTSRSSTLVYMAFQHARFTRPAGRPAKPWAFTPRFHHHPPNSKRLPFHYSDKSAYAKATADEGCNFLWHCLFPFFSKPKKKTRLFTGTLPYAVQTFLPSPKRKAIARFVVKSKNTEYSWKANTAESLKAKGESKYSCKL